MGAQLPTPVASEVCGWPVLWVTVGRTSYSSEGGRLAASWLDRCILGILGRILLSDSDNWLVKIGITFLNVKCFPNSCEKGFPSGLIHVHVFL